MIRLLLKYMIGFIVLGLFSIVVLYLIANSLLQRSTIQTIQTYNQGIFHLLQTQLLRYPQSSWTTVIKKLQPQNSNPITVIPLFAVAMNKNDLQSLLKGQTVVVIGADTFYFGYGVSDIASYQLIDHSHFVLRLQEIPLPQIAQQVSAWMTQLISVELQSTPSQKWANKIVELQQYFGLPLTLLTANDPTIPHMVATTLKHNPFAVGDSQSGKIEYAYIHINKNNVVRIGPIPYPFYPQYQLYILVLIFLLIVITAIISSTYIFSHNLDKIYQITEKYSRGDFAHLPRFSRYSTLRTLYDNIWLMGNKIQSLIKSQRNLTRFIAHECRTPISTMLFAIDSLEKEDLSPTAQQNIQNIKADLADLNDLVSNFLNYARYSSEKLQLHCQPTDIISWLQACTEKYKTAPKKITLLPTPIQSLIINFDAELMKHVIYNLIDNALKHAVREIQITVELPNKNCTIHVDDDGIQIDDENKQNIFAPFVSLDDNDSKASPGFGLGLTIAETIVKRHLGSLTVNDSPLGGARFTISLPL